MAIDTSTLAAPGHSDAALLHEVIGGSQDAFASLYDRHIGAVYAAALRVSQDPSVVAEIVQDTFLALWNRAERFDASRGSLRAWLATIARNRGIDQFRASSRHQRATSFSSFGLPDTEEALTVEWLLTSGSLVAAAGPDRAPEEASLESETRATLNGALASLAAPERSAILLAYQGDLSQSEIAERLGWPLGTVKTRTRRALRQLRDRLQAPTGMPSPATAAAAAAARPLPACGG